jgi:hypothetical protein
MVAAIPSLLTALDIGESNGVFDLTEWLFDLVRQWSIWTLNFWSVVGKLFSYIPFVEIPPLSESQADTLSAAILWIIAPITIAYVRRSQFNVLKNSAIGISILYFGQIIIGFDGNVIMAALILGAIITFIIFPIVQIGDYFLSKDMDSLTFYFELIETHIAVILWVSGLIAVSHVDISGLSLRF